MRCQVPSNFTKTMFKVEFFVNINVKYIITLEQLKDVRFIKNDQKKVFSLHRTKFSENSDFLVNH